MKAISTITSLIDKLGEIVGKIAMYISIVLMAVIMFEVISRRIFNAPTLWTYETSTMLFGAFILFIMPYGMLKNVNVSVDIFVERMSERSKKILDFIMYFLLFFPFYIVLFYAGVKFAVSSWQVLETSWSTWRPPLYYIKTCIPVAAFLTLLQGVSELLKKLMEIIALSKYEAPKDSIGRQQKEEGEKND